MLIVLIVCTRQCSKFLHGLFHLNPKTSWNSCFSHFMDRDVINHTVPLILDHKLSLHHPFSQWFSSKSLYRTFPSPELVFLSLDLLPLNNALCNLLRVILPKTSLWLCCFLATSSCFTYYSPKTPSQSKPPPIFPNFFFYCHAIKAVVKLISSNLFSIFKVIFFPASCFACLVLRVWVPLTSPLSLPSMPVEILYNTRDGLACHFVFS